MSIFPIYERINTSICAIDTFMGCITQCRGWELGWVSDYVDETIGFMVID